MKRVLRFLNMLSLIIAVLVNYYVNAKKAGVPSISEISSHYPTLLTLAGICIWYLSILCVYGCQNRVTASFAIQIKQIEEH